MTQTDMAMLALLFGVLLFVGVRHLVEAGPEPITPDPAPVYEAPFRQPGPDLPQRPEGMKSLKAEIAKTPPGRHRAPELKVHKVHPDWAWNTQEWEQARDSFFADVPDDQAVIKAWAGVGHVG